MARVLARIHGRWYVLMVQISLKSLTITTFSSFVQFLEFVRTIDAKFEKYDMEGAYCSDYLAHAKLTFLPSCLAFDH